MSKLTKQNVGGVNYTMVGCTLTGVCPSAAADFVKVVTLSDGDALSDGMMVACTFANGNTAGEAPETLTIYSSDQVNYYSDSELTQPFTLAPSGCYTIEYTGTGNAYTYSSFPVIQVGDVSGPLCASNGTPSGGTAWSAGDTVLLLYTGGKFLAVNVTTNAVTANNLHSVTSGAVYNKTFAIESIMAFRLLIPSPANVETYVKIRMPNYDKSRECPLVLCQAWSTLYGLTEGSIAKILYGSLYGIKGISWPAYTEDNDNFFWLKISAYRQLCLISTHQMRVVERTTTPPSGVTFTAPV